MDEGVSPRWCGVRFHNCTCDKDAGHVGPHVCKCDGSWNDDGEILAYPNIAQGPILQD